MKNTLKLFAIIGSIAFFSGLGSCKKQLNQTPKYGLNVEVVYGDYDNYLHVLAKLYSGLSMTGIQGPAGKGDIAGIDEGFSAYVRVLFNLQELPTDEAVCGWNDPGIPELNKSTWSPETSFVKGMYFRIFYQITLCNEFIRETTEEKMTERGFTDAQKATIRTYTAEARFLRALSYAHAMDLFGNVPFVTEDDKVGAFQPARITRSDLFAYVESELLDIESSLLSPGAAPYGRASSAAAQFLLARIYLNAEVYAGTNRYADCATYCTKVINSGAFTLDDHYTDLFLADNDNSPEIIFPVVYDGLYAQTWGGTTFLVCASLGGSMVAADYGVNGKWGGLRATAPFVDKFPDTTLDSRYQFYTNGQTKDITSLSTFSQGYALPKFKNKTSLGSNGSNNGTTAFVDIDFPMFRLADVYLMYAEAALRGGGSTSQGISYVNMLRERAYGNASHNFASMTLDDVLDERARELHWECTRRTDLIRFDKFTGGSYLWPFKGGDVNGISTSAHLNLYPIPTSDIVLNPNLIQNPGY
ncbi:MAG: hypothetical protein RI922_850 [Bacteroidota bacterium]|jgi:hypothetical protein